MPNQIFRSIKQNKWIDENIRWSAYKMPWNRCKRFVYTRNLIWLGWIRSVSFGSWRLIKSWICRKSTAHCDCKHFIELFNKFKYQNFNTEFMFKQIKENCSDSILRIAHTPKRLKWHFAKTNSSMCHLCEQCQIDVMILDDFYVFGRTRSYSLPSISPLFGAQTERDGEKNGWNAVKTEIPTKIVTWNLSAANAYDRMRQHINSKPHSESVPSRKKLQCHVMSQRQ